MIFLPIVAMASAAFALGMLLARLTDHLAGTNKYVAWNDRPLVFTSVVAVGLIALALWSLA